jgi:biotin transport system substrate-specific component
MFLSACFSNRSLLRHFALVLGLSWLYAICAQVALWLPCLPVPIYLHPLPLFVTAYFFGWVAVQAYFLYLVQGAVGLPFFAGMHAGFMRLLGPTGGYLLGFLVAMVLFVFLRRLKNLAWYELVATSWLASLVYFACGLWRLSCFVPTQDLLAAGLLPFLFGDLILKPMALVCFVLLRKK